MATLNKKDHVIAPVTHEGSKASRITAEQELRRSVMSCMLWEDTFYEGGDSIARRIEGLIPKVKPEIASQIAREARNQMYLRHVPLLIARVMAKLQTHKAEVSDLLHDVIQRPDELTEFLAIYWKEKRQSLSAQVKKGLARAFTKFKEYHLAKYNQDGKVKLRDVLFLSHAKPLDGVRGFDKKARKEGKTFPSGEGSQLFKKLVDGTLSTPDTWEVELSKATDKTAAWTNRLSEGKMDGLALIRNLRNMIEAKVNLALIKKALSDMHTERILPFRFIAAARHALNLEPELEAAMFKSIEGKEKFEGKTLLVVDVSGSMDDHLSHNSGRRGVSEMKRHDASYGLAILLREMCDDITIYSFSDHTKLIPPRRGFALRDVINSSQRHNGTYLGKAITLIHNDIAHYDRIIVITDEQAHDTIPDPRGKGYIINVAAYQNGVGYGKWVHINGWSEKVLDYIKMYESTDR